MVAPKVPERVAPLVSESAARTVVQSVVWLAF